MSEEDKEMSPVALHLRLRQVEAESASMARALEKIADKMAAFDARQDRAESAMKSLPAQIAEVLEDRIFAKFDSRLNEHCEKRELMRIKIEHEAKKADKSLTGPMAFGAGVAWAISNWEKLSEWVRSLGK